jgi:hypothetical protein
MDKILARSNGTDEDISFSHVFSRSEGRATGGASFKGPRVAYNGVGAAYKFSLSNAFRAGIFPHVDAIAQRALGLLQAAQVFGFIPLSTCMGNCETIRREQKGWRRYR